MKSYISELEHSPENNAHALNARCYLEDEFLALENQHIFESYWQMVGHESQLSLAGDQIAVQIDKVPIVIVRDMDNQLKAFHNVCRHRAGPLVTEKANSKVLRCKYHGWTYQLDGQLKSAPEMQSTQNFDVCQHHLPKAFVDVWQGFIFASVNQPKISLQEFLGDISEQIKPIDLEQMQYSHRDEYLIECNWKVYMDNYLEGYHLPHIHPGLSKLLDYRSYDTKLYDWYSYQFSPLDNAEKNDAAIYYGEGSAHYYCIFPNLMLNILPGRLQTNLIIPEGSEKTRIIFDYYYPDLDSEKTKALIKQDRDFSDEVQQEDVDICERVQRGLASGSYHSGPLCMKRETGVLHFQNLVRRALREAID